MTDDNDAWTMAPLKGLGKVVFGATSDEVSRYDTVYGEVETRNTIGADLTELESSLRSSGTLSEDVILNILRNARDQSAGTDGMVDEHRPNGLQATFYRERLIGFFTDYRTNALHIEGRRFFGEDPLNALRHLQTLNAAPPLLKGLDCVFDQIKVIAYGFLDANGNGYRLLQSAPIVGSRGDHSISWGIGLDRADEDLADYQRIPI